MYINGVGDKKAHQMLFIIGFDSLRFRRNCGLGFTLTQGEPVYVYSVYPMYIYY